MALKKPKLKKLPKMPKNAKNSSANMASYAQKLAMVIKENEERMAFYEREKKLIAKNAEAVNKLKEKARLKKR